MLYKLDIANLALGRLGTSVSILDYNSENTAQAKIIRRHFRFSLDTLLEKHDWNFATKFAPLCLVSEDSEDNFKYTYQIPTDCLVIREIAEFGKFYPVSRYEDEKIQWQQVFNSSGPRIKTNLPDAYAKYTVRVSEDIQFPSHFGRALIAQLALDIAPSMVTNNYAKIRNDLMTEVSNEITRGIANDLGREPQQLNSLSPFIRARYE
jgi:hypothetical protein